MTQHGLTSPHLQIIKEILKPFAEHIERVALFGSRAQETHKPYSDIDLVLYGNLDEADADRLWTLFQESPLPFKVDVKVYHLMTYPPLKDHIDRVAQTLFTHLQLTDNA